MNKLLMKVSWPDPNKILMMPTKEFLITPPPLKLVTKKLPKLKLSEPKDKTTLQLHNKILPMN